MSTDRDSTTTIDRRTLLLGTLGVAASGSAFAQARTAKPVKIGVLTDMSSLYADCTGKGSVLATQMAAEDFAKIGQSLPFEVTFADHQNKADIASSVARKWIDQDGVDVIVDVPNSAVALAVGSIVRDKNKVMLASGPSSSDLTGKACSPNNIHWTYDTYALATGAATAVVQSGGKSWFNLTADYAFGHAMEQDVKNVVTRNGGTVKGGVRTPLGTQDFSSFLLQAQASGAQVVGLINAGGDTINSIKQAVEFGVTASGQRLVATVLYVTDVHSLGLDVAKGLQFTEAFYWDLNDETRAWTKRFVARNEQRYPSALHAGAYGSVLHYLRAVNALGIPMTGRGARNATSIARALRWTTCSSPAIGFILYGTVGQVSIGRLFAASIIPGILLWAALAAAISLTARKRGYEPERERAPRPAEIGNALLGGIWALLFPGILLLGLAVREEALRHHQVQIVLGPRHRDIEQPALLLDLVAGADAEIGRDAAIRVT